MGGAGPETGAATLPPEDVGRRFRRLFLSIALPMSLAVVDQTIVATALPDIAGDLGRIDLISWVVVSYLVAATIAAPVYGRLGDVFGRRRLLQISVVIFVLASLLCAFAVNMQMLIACRIVQGFGGGGLMTLAHALIGETVPPRQRGRYQGYLATVIVTSNSMGPVLGGLMTQSFGWQSVFLMNVPLGLLALALTFRLPRLPPSDAPFRFDWAGLLLFAAFIASCLIMLEFAKGVSIASIPLVAALAAAAACALVLLIRQENRADDPLIPLSLLRQPVLWRSDALVACHGAVLVSLIMLLPLYFRIGRQVSAGEVGLLMLPMMIGVGCGAFFTGRLITRTGLTAVIPSYGLPVVVAMLAFLALWGSNLGLVTFACLLGLTAVFIGTSMPVAQVTVQAVAGPTMLGAASASVQFSRSLGSAFGTAVVGIVLFLALPGADHELGPLVEAVFRDGAEALAGLSETERRIVRAELDGAFSAALATIALFAAAGWLFACSIPMRRM